MGGLLSVVRKLIGHAPVPGALALVAATQVASSAMTHFFPSIPLEAADVVSLLSANGLAVVYYLRGGRMPAQRALVACVTLWAVRLAAFLGRRTLRGFRDGRLDDMRSTRVGACKWAVAQTVWIFTTLLPVWVALPAGVAAASSQAPSAAARLSAVDGAAIGVFMAGFLCEAVADEQKASFVAEAKQHASDATGTGGARGEAWCQRGLFKYSRFPNYLGEWLMWTALSVLSFRISTGPTRLCLPVVPVFLHQLFHKVSIAMATEKMKRRLSDAEYRDWCRTPLFFPFAAFQKRDE